MTHRNRSIRRFSRAKRRLLDRVYGQGKATLNFDLRDAVADYKALFEAENDDIDTGNTSCRDINSE